MIMMFQLLALVEYGDRALYGPGFVQPTRRLQRHGASVFFCYFFLFFLIVLFVLFVRQ